MLTADIAFPEIMYNATSTTKSGILDKKHIANGPLVL